MGRAAGARSRSLPLSWRTYLHAALRHPSEAKILLLRSDRRWRAPRVVVPGRVWAADTPTVVAAFERGLGTQPWVLRRVDTENDEARRTRSALYELQVVDGLWEAPRHARWVGDGDLEGLGLADEGERDRLAGYLARIDDVPEQRTPWARPGWLEEIRPWIEQEVARLGHVLLGLEQVKQWSISSVLRVDTDGPDFYVKVPIRLPLFAEEAVVTGRLAERFPDYVPRPLALEPEQGWMLLPRFEELLDWDSPLELRQEVLRRFAGLQLQSAELTDELLADGCLDRRLDVLEGQIDSLLSDPTAVRQLDADEVKALRGLAPTLRDVCRRLAACGLPATLVHGDLHVGNIARNGGRLQYFDWTDACIGHPFIDLLSLQWERDEAVRAALLEAYLEPWQLVAPIGRLREAAHLAAVVIPLHHAVSYATIVNGLEPAAASEADATHEFLREVLARATALERG